MSPALAVVNLARIEVVRKWDYRYFGAQCLLVARLGPAEVLAIRQLSGGKRTDLKRAALSRFVRTRLDIVPWGT